MIKVSVIIPVYNVEEYLKECLDSVINQTLKEIEIICIDDCSTDNSYNILEEYAKKDDRITIIKNEENLGVGISRNKGIKLSNGEYIGFVDGDDYIANNYFEALYNTAKKYGSDVSYTLNLYRDINGELVKYINIYDFFPKEEIKKFNIEGSNNINIINHRYGNKDYAFVVIWNKIFKKSFLEKNNLYFLEIKARWGDTDFYYRVLCNKPKSSYNHSVIYYYRENSLSIVNISSVEDNIKALKHLENSIKYYEEKSNITDIRYLHTSIWEDIYTLFKQSMYTSNFYDYIFEFSNKLSIIKNITPKYLYEEYVIIKNNNTYEKYSLNKIIYNDINNLEYRINELKYNIYSLQENVKKFDNWFRLFGINNSKDCLIIIVFGIKISIKKKNDKDI